MNLTWHIVKKDLRSLKWPLLLWTLLIVAKLGVGVMLLNSDTTQGKEWFMRMDALGKILGGLECVSFVLVAAFIQEDMLVGTTAFWMTRPISGARLLKAKLLGIGLIFLLVPVLVTLPWWLGCGYGVREVAWAALETVVVHAIFMLLGLLWSVVTDGFARFLAWTLVTLFVIPTITTTLIYYTTGRGQHGPGGDVTTTRIVIGVVLAVIGIAVVVVHQYLTRHTWRSISIIGATAGLIVLAGVFAPWAGHIEHRTYGYVVSLAGAGWKSNGEPAGLTYTVEPAKLGPRAQNTKTAWRQLSGTFRVDGIAETEVLQPGFSEHTWRWSDGKIEKGYTYSQSESEGLAAQKALGMAGKTAGDGRYSDTMRTRAVVTPEIGEKLVATTPAYTLKVGFRLLKLESVTTLPQQPGPRELRGARSERIGGAEKDGEALQVTIVRSNPSLVVDNFAGQPYPSGRFGEYLLVNRDFVDRGRPKDRLSTRIGTVEIAWQTVAFWASPKAGGMRPSIEAINALDDAKLVRVLFREVARFTREIQTEAFVTEPSAP